MTSSSAGMWTSLSFGDFGPGFGDGGDIHHDVGAMYAERDADRVATAGFADGGDIDCRAAVPANHILAVRAVAFCPANAARIQRHAPALRLLDDQEPERLIAGFNSKKMQIPVLHFAERHAEFVTRRTGSRNRAC